MKARRKTKKRKASFNILGKPRRKGHPLTKQARLRLLGKDNESLRANIKGFELRLRQTTEENERLRTKVKELSQEFLWYPADGPPLRPREMEESHLRNTISYLQRVLTRQFGSVRYLSQTEKMAHAFWIMLREAKRRGIDV